MIFFGYACGKKETYPEMVSPYTNVYTLTPESLTENIDLYLRRLSSLGMKAIIALNPIVCDNNTGLRRYDWLTRLNQWAAAQGKTIDNRVEAFYLPDEPYHIGWTALELKTVSDRVKVLFPNHKQMMIEAYTKVRSLGTTKYPIPVNVQYVGFDRYGTLEPHTDQEYALDYNALKARLGTRKMVVVGESQWNNYYQEAGATMGFDINVMGPIFDSYCLVAKRPEVGMFLLYSMNNGFEGPDYIGAEGMPKTVLDKHIAAGKIMTGKV